MEFYLFISRESEEKGSIDCEMESEEAESSSENKPNSSIKKQVSKRKSSQKNKKNFSLMIESIDSVDY